MLAPWLDDPGAADSVARWSVAAGLDLRRLGVDAGADEIVDTAVTQPLVVAAALLAAARLTAKSELPAGVVAAGLTPADPVRPLLSNADGAVVRDGAEVLRRLVAQVTRPVRWDSCTATMRELGVGAVVELPPAGTLVGIAKRELKGTPTLALKTPDDLSGATDLITEHGGTDT